MPAAFCGIYGLKPSYGMISRWGVISYADTLDTVGIMAQTVEDVKHVYEVLAEEDERDATCVSNATRVQLRESVEHVISRIPSRLDGVRVGLVMEMFPSEVSDETLSMIDAVLSHMAALGATIVPLTIPAIRKAASAYYILSLSEASSNLSRFDGLRYGTHTESEATSFQEEIAQNRSYGFGDEVKRRLLLGTYALTSEAWDSHYVRAMSNRNAITRAYEACWRTPDLRSEKPRQHDAGVDVIVQPTTLGIAPKLDEPMTGEYAADILAIAANHAGLPAISAPSTTTVPIEGGARMPIGVSFMTQWGHDAFLFYVLEQLRQHTDVLR